MIQELCLLLPAVSPIPPGMVVLEHVNKDQPVELRLIPSAWIDSHLLQPGLRKHCCVSAGAEEHETCQHTRALQQRIVVRQSA